MKLIKSSIIFSTFFIFTFFTIPWQTNDSGWNLGIWAALRELHP
jgi:hypothetical protein